MEVLLRAEIQPRLSVCVTLSVFSAPPPHTTLCWYEGRAIYTESSVHSLPLHGSMMHWFSSHHHHQQQWHHLPSSSTKKEQVDSFLAITVPVYKYITWHPKVVFQLSLQASLAAFNTVLPPARPSQNHLIWVDLSLMAPLGLCWVIECCWSLLTQSSSLPTWLSRESSDLSGLDSDSHS